MKPLFPLKSAIGALLLAGCAKRTWVMDERPLHRPEVTPIEDPLFVVEGMPVEDSQFVVEGNPVDAEPGDLAIEGTVLLVARTQYSQNFRTFQRGEVSRDEANKKGKIWMWCAGGALVLPFFLTLMEDDYGYRYLEPRAASFTGLSIAIPLVIMGTGQYLSPLLPDARRDREKERREWVVEDDPVPAAGIPIAARVGDEPFATDTIWPDAYYRLPVELRTIPPEVWLFVGESKEPAMSVGLTGTSAWRMQSRSKVRSLVSTGKLEEAGQAVMESETYDPELWATYCTAFSAALPTLELRVATSAFRGEYSEPSCQTTWDGISEQWATRVLDDAVAGNVDAVAAGLVGSEPASSHTLAIDAIVACAEVAAIRGRAATESNEDYYRKVSHAVEWLELAEALGSEAAATCASRVSESPKVDFQAAQRAWEAELSRRERETERETGRKLATCEQLQRQRVAAGRQVFSSSMESALQQGLFRLRDEIYGIANKAIQASRVPTHEEQEMVQCLGYVGGDAQDMYESLARGLAYHTLPKIEFETWDGVSSTVLRRFKSVANGDNDECSVRARVLLGQTVTGRLDKLLLVENRFSDHGCDDLLR